MRRNRILAITFCALACLGYPKRSANAGWFGPGNYHECVLEKMKGQSPYMLETAQSACELEFPCPDKYHKDEFDAVLRICLQKLGPRPSPYDGLIADHYFAAALGCDSAAKQQMCLDR